MEKGFNLGEKIKEMEESITLISGEDRRKLLFALLKRFIDENKEFIKRLKDVLICPNCNFCGFHNKITEIDKLAGEKFS